jgi:hypothetical protein
MADDLHTPHKMYMRLFALETERHRRQQERASAVQRVTNIDTRCTEIDAEKEQLLRLLGVESIALALDGQPASNGAPAASAAARRGRARTGRQTAPVETQVCDAVRIRY